MLQLCLFEETQEEKFDKRMKELEDKLERQRKGQFAKIGALTKMYNETRHELETLKSAICKGVS